MIDRVNNVFVVDIIYLKFLPPDFNLADLFIVIGVNIFLFAFWRISTSLENCPW